MSRPGPRDIERRLAELEPEEPPEGLLARLKADIPAVLPVQPEIQERATAPAASAGRAAGWPGRRTWLAAALLVMTLGGGWLALQMRSRIPAPEESEVARDAAATAPAAAGAPAPEPEPPPARAAGTMEQSREEQARRDAPAVGEAAAVPAPAPAAPKVSPPAELEQGVVGGVEGGVVGGVVGGVPGGMVATETVPEEHSAAQPTPLPALRAQEMAKDVAAPAPPPPPAGRVELDDSPLRVGEPLEKQRQEEKEEQAWNERRKRDAARLSVPAGAAREGWLERFDLLPPLAAGSAWQLRASAVPSALSPGTYWLRVEARARQGRQGESVGSGVELAVEPRGAPVDLRAVGGGRQSKLQRGLDAGTVAGGARWLAVFAAAPRGGTGALTISLRYREAGGGEPRELAETLDLRRAPARFADASPEERLLALAADLARARERPVRRELLEIARLADRLADESGNRPWTARATELAEQARRTAASAPR